MERAYKYFYNPFVEMNEQQLFLNALHHDSRNGYVRKIEIDARDNVKNFGSKNVEEMEDYNNDYNIYISLNSFQTFKRKAENTRTINAIYFDLDIWMQKPTQSSAPTIMQD